MAQDCVDTFGIPEFFCEALLPIQKVGSCRRLVFTVNRTDGRESCKIAVISVVLPAEAVADIAQMLASDVHDHATMLALAAPSTNTLAN